MKFGLSKPERLHGSRRVLALSGQTMAFVGAMFPAAQRWPLSVTLLQFQRLGILEDFLADGVRNVRRNSVPTG